MAQLEETAEKVASLIDAEFELFSNECLFKKTRTLNIITEKSNFPCSLQLDISFSRYKEDGTASNKAAILLLPEEMPAFVHAWTEYEIPLPAYYRQHCDMNPNIVCIHLETIEAPENFARRLSSALNGLETEAGENQLSELKS